MVNLPASWFTIAVCCSCELTLSIESNWYLFVGGATSLARQRTLA